MILIIQGSFPFPLLPIDFNDPTEYPKSFYFLYNYLPPFCSSYFLLMKNW